LGNKFERLPLNIDGPRTEITIFSRLTKKREPGLPSRESHVRGASLDSRPDRINCCKNGGNMWNRIMEDYSGREITCQEDRLPAIAGVAEVLLEIWNKEDAYIAGMWKSCFVEQLGWYFTDSKPTSEPPCIYVAPSWSWLSANQKIMTKKARSHMPEEYEYSAIAELEDYMLYPKDRKTPLGQLSGGWIRLKAPTLQKKTFKQVYAFTVIMDNPEGECYSDSWIVLLGRTRIMLNGKYVNFSEGLILEPMGDEDSVTIRTGRWEKREERDNEYPWKELENIPKEVFIIH
jgi:hypothetical protein